MGKLFLYVVLALFVADVYLLVSNNRILVHERLVHPGDFYVVDDYGNLGKNSQAQLACTYFNGRSFKTMVFWYSSDNILGRDSCSFLYRV